MDRDFSDRERAVQFVLSYYSVATTLPHATDAEKAEVRRLLNKAREILLKLQECPNLREAYRAYLEQIDSAITGFWGT